MTDQTPDTRAMPTGTELPGEHWNARLIREGAGQLAPFGKLDLGQQPADAAPYDAGDAPVASRPLPVHDEPEQLRRDRDAARLLATGRLAEMYDRDRQIATLTAERDQARAALEQAKRQAFTEASDLLWAWAEEMGDVGGTGPRAARKRTIKACARKIAPEPTDDEMRAALAELLSGMADRAKAAALGSAGPRAQDDEATARRRHALVFNALTRTLLDIGPFVPLSVWEKCVEAVLAALDQQEG
ncbi:hypothetical protein GA0074692_0026 [Micromonospora pallida]|uniref:Uncharacterized protein n=1 Tax=Micromonospora pallida TaxID=145854 RepID=A0A1C6RGV9_9ACTN|nr:hypothetical protein [Micromonospora pallida]SCL16424.1 hypothetical protein GA0074692_0026 [Micromonospora pallida]